MRTILASVRFTKLMNTGRAPSAWRQVRGGSPRHPRPGGLVSDVTDCRRISSFKWWGRLTLYLIEPRNRQIRLKTAFPRWVHQKKVGEQGHTAPQLTGLKVQRLFD